jgi:hypothetical protein
MRGCWRFRGWLRLLGLVMVTVVVVVVRPMVVLGWERVVKVCGMVEGLGVVSAPRRRRSRHHR